MHSVERNVQLFAGFLFVHRELGQVARQALFYIVVFPLCIAFYIVWSSCCLCKFEQKGSIVCHAGGPPLETAIFLSKEEYILYTCRIYKDLVDGFGGHVRFDERSGKT